MAGNKPVLRCAVYTRKSSEEGLEQEFNSLDAQREAGMAYIKSQAHEGWRPLRARYDDGGYSGGSLERPALARLLMDMRAGKIDVVVVYKVDRLTRSLNDFAKLVEVFDGQGISFVSVTQQFNTTTSMGRLMLNVLLSFAQFEREVTGERIRDKIGASKKKGMWMGGVPPMGYEVSDRKLVVNDGDAERVRHIFQRYVDLGCISRLARELDAGGYRTRRYVSRAGRTTGDRPFSRGHLHRILTNRIYLGEIVHQGNAYPGEHDAIVDEALWRRADDLLSANRNGKSGRKGEAAPALLRGLVHDDAGNRMSPQSVLKGRRRYGYYVSQALIKGQRENAGSVPRVPAAQLEQLVVGAVRSRLREASQSGNCGEDEGPSQEELLRGIVRRVVVKDGLVAITVGSQPDENAVPTPNGLDAPPKTETIEVPAELVRNGGRSCLRAGGGASLVRKRPDPRLIRAVSRAHVWYGQLRSGEVASVSDLARRENVTPPYVSRILRLAFLAPDLTEAILEGSQAMGLTLERLRHGIPVDWNEQRRLFGVSYAQL